MTNEEAVAADTPDETDETPDEAVTGEVTDESQAATASAPVRSTGDPAGERQRAARKRTTPWA